MAKARVGDCQDRRRRARAQSRPRSSASIPPRLALSSLMASRCVWYHLRSKFTVGIVQPRANAAEGKKIAMPRFRYPTRHTRSVDARAGRRNKPAWQRKSGRIGAAVGTQSVCNRIAVGAQSDRWRTAVGSHRNRGAIGSRPGRNRGGGGQSGSHRVAIGSHSVPALNGIGAQSPHHRGRRPANGQAPGRFGQNAGAGERARLLVGLDDTPHDM